MIYFFEDYKVYTPIRFEVYSLRQYGQPKLTKPRELKGIKQVMSIDYIAKKCRCPIFIKDDDVWIQHNDYFSESMKLPLEDIGMPLEYLAKKHLNKDNRKKFIYPDAWGRIVLRNQAWLRIHNLLKQIHENRFQSDIIRDIREQQEKLHSFEELDLCCTDMERFWEKLVRELYKM